MARDVAIRLSFCLVIATGAMTAGCAPSRVGPQPFPIPGGPPARQPLTEAPPDMDGVLATALNLRGVPYRSGGTDPSGFDCSGFIQYVFAQHGVALPRDVHDQYRFGKKIGERDVRPGDLLFFSTTGKGASHVGIALGRGEFVHAPSSRGVVRIEQMSSRYWSKRFVGVRRLFW